MRHRVVEATRLDAEDVVDAFNPQASTQLDGLAHVRAREYGYYAGCPDIAQARERLGMHHWAKRGIAGRGVLLDAARFWERNGNDVDPFRGTEITVDDLLAIAGAQGVAIERGDILLVRTGWTERFLALGADARERVGAWNGLRADGRMAEFLWDSGLSLIGADNPAVENAPGSREVGSLHRRLLPALGISLMELLDLSRLSKVCEEQGRWEFFFVSVPLHLRGAVSSPANAMAML
nr:cyclase family protein [Leucobacter weissii]